MEILFMDTENSKSNEPHTFVLNLTERLDLRSLNKHVAIQNMSTYYNWKNVIHKYRSNIIITPNNSSNGK